MATPYVTIVRNVVPSTQDLAAAELDRTGRPALVIAHSQTAGRGRSGNEWWQATRAIAASLAFVADAVPDTFSLGVGLAVRAAVLEVTGVVADLKWPNDIEVAGGKVGGILVESTGPRIIVGCGLNIFWPDPPTGVRGLLDTDPGPETGVAISETWAQAVHDEGGAWNRDDYVAACSTLGSVVTWRGGGPGKALTVDDAGGLVVDTDDGPTTLRSGEVRTLRRLSDDA